MRTETLECDIKQYLGDFGDVPRVNNTSSQDENLLGWFSERDYKRVKQCFAGDFEIFGYA